MILALEAVVLMDTSNSGSQVLDAIDRDEPYLIRGAG